MTSSSIFGYPLRRVQTPVPCRNVYKSTSTIVMRQCSRFSFPSTGNMTCCGLLVICCLIGLSAMVASEYSEQYPEHPKNLPTREIDEKAREKILASCRSQPGKCKTQPDWAKRTRQNAKTSLVYELRASGKSDREANAQAENRLKKIHALKKRWYSMHGLQDIDPADNGRWMGCLILRDDQIDAINKQLDRTTGGGGTVPHGGPKRTHKRAASLFFEQVPNDRWKMPIHYWISDEYSARDKAIIDDGVKTITQRMNGCIRFVKDPVANMSKPQLQYLVEDATGCGGHSPLGVGPDPIHVITLGARGTPCDPAYMKGSVIHETIHALGGGHEHSRIDREEHIKILWENIEGQEGLNAYQRDIGKTSYGIPYDIKSIMHYRSGGFGRNGMDTMVSLDGRKIEQNNDLAESDVEQLRRMYCRPASCVDAYGGCGHLAAGPVQFCTDKRSKDWMSRRCRRSCGLC